jgi:hypothetical protein
MKRGPKPKGKIKIEWSPDFAYAIGLIVTDGCLYNDRRHMSFVSQDMELVLMFKKILNLEAKIGLKRSKKNNKRTTPHIQFGDVLFYKFLEGIGLTPAKSLTIRKIYIPEELFFDFLRGCFDGDGSSYSYWDPRWKSSFMYYTSFASGSMLFLDWLRKEIFRRIGIKGHLTKAKRKSASQLKYAKKESLVLYRNMYYKGVSSYLVRKKLKIDNALAIVGERI